MNHVYKQVLGMPCFIMDSSDSIRKLDDPMESITNTTSLNRATAAYDAVETVCGKFNQGGNPPLTVSIVHNKLVVVA